MSCTAHITAHLHTIVCMQTHTLSCACTPTHYHTHTHATTLSHMHTHTLSHAHHTVTHAHPHTITYTHTPSHIHTSQLYHTCTPHAPYIIEGFGNATRIDYGTGHEAKFMAFVCCLMKIGVVLREDAAAVVLKVVKR